MDDDVLKGEADGNSSEIIRLHCQTQKRACVLMKYLEELTKHGHGKLILTMKKGKVYEVEIYKSYR